MRYSVTLVTKNYDELGTVESDAVLAIPNVGDDVALESRIGDVEAQVKSRRFIYDTDTGECRVYLYCVDVTQTGETPAPRQPGRPVRRPLFMPEEIQEAVREAEASIAAHQKKATAEEE